ncbi:peptidase S1 and S6 chymotrypsin/Hap [Thiothrix nivea DSM 5205]|uniref:Peptidase S1 and S6 chymotrypsin/Hap n=2 Tax=Thiothrix nivea TaxID=1031 RepID=A0A656HHY5_THINJ|nr:peptidase S1 and S6 chymotrypsin/Hap [Thiothrix nivea DSM 5205]
MLKLLSICLLALSLSGCSLIPCQQGSMLNPRESGKAFAAVTRQVSPSVVSVQAEFPVDPASMQFPFDKDLFKRLFGDLPEGLLPPTDLPPEAQVETSQGSGFVFRAEKSRSYILTTYHVVQDARSVRVMLLNGKEFEASVKGVDTHSDIAVLEIPTGDTLPLALGDSAQLDVGEWVLAIGNPFGLQHTLTAGVVSAKGRTALGINDYEDFIQTDAAINPGNSGGPLVNLDAQVVGMNTAIFSSSGGYMGIGFAIPVNFVKTVAEQLIQQGSVVRGQLGVLIETLTRETAQRLQLPAGQTGILVVEVQPGTPAAKAGFRLDDVIVSYAGKPVRDLGAFRNQVAATSPGSRQPIGILRNGKPQTLSVEIGQLP